MEFEQAVLIDFPLQTAVAALHLYLGAGTPGTGSAEDKVLIWGAGGAVGSYAVQYAKSVSGFHSYAQRRATCGLKSSKSMLATN